MFCWGKQRDQRRAARCVCVCAPMGDSASQLTRAAPLARARATRTIVARGADARRILQAPVAPRDRARSSDLRGAARCRKQVAACCGVEMSTPASASLARSSCLLRRSRQWCVCRRRVVRVNGGSAGKGARLCAVDQALVTHTRSKPTPNMLFQGGGKSNSSEGGLNACPHCV